MIKLNVDLLFKKNKQVFNCEELYSVGDIIHTENSNNPSEKYGGTWIKIASGRALVGYDSLQTEFNTVGKTGGSKYLQKHKHTITLVKSSQGNLYYPDFPSGYNSTNSGISDCQNAIQESGTGDSGNLQPYYVCYIWKKTA